MQLVLMIVLFLIFVYPILLYLHKSSNGMCKVTRDKNTIIWFLLNMLNSIFIGLFGFVMDIMLPSCSKVSETLKETYEALPDPDAE